MKNDQRLLAVHHHRQKQDQHKRVLCVCSAGMVRSATAAWLLSNPPYNFNTRACGTKNYALVQLDEVLLEWADVVVFMEYEHYNDAECNFDLKGKVNTVLQVPDEFEYRQKELVKVLDRRFREIFDE